MKLSGLIILIILSFCSLRAQEVTFEKEKNYYVQKLNLSEDQIVKLNTILSKKYENLNFLEVFRNQNEELFRKKRRAIFSGTEASIRLLIEEDQLELWTILKKEERIKRAEHIKTLQKSKADIKDILDAQYGIFQRDKEK